VPRALTGDKFFRVKVMYFSRDLAWIVRSVEGANIVDAGFASYEVLPEGVFPNSVRRHNTEASHYDATTTTQRFPPRTNAARSLLLAGC